MVEQLTESGYFFSLEKNRKKKTLGNVNPAIQNQISMNFNVVLCQADQSKCSVNSRCCVFQPKPLFVNSFLAYY